MDDRIKAYTTFSWDAKLINEEYGASRTPLHDIRDDLKSRSDIAEVETQEDAYGFEGLYVELKDGESAMFYLDDEANDGRTLKACVAGYKQDIWAFGVAKTTDPSSIIHFLESLDKEWFIENDPDGEMWEDGDDEEE